MVVGYRERPTTEQEIYLCSSSKTFHAALGRIKSIRSPFEKIWLSWAMHAWMILIASMRKCLIFPWSYWQQWQVGLSLFWAMGASSSSTKRKGKLPQENESGLLLTITFLTSLSLSISLLFFLLCCVHSRLTSPMPLLVILSSVFSPPHNQGRSWPRRRSARPLISSLPMMSLCQHLVPAPVLSRVQIFPALVRSLRSIHRTLALFLALSASELFISYRLELPLTISSWRCRTSSPSSRHPLTFVVNGSTLPQRRQRARKITGFIGHWHSRSDEWGVTFALCLWPLIGTVLQCFFFRYLRDWNWTSYIQVTPLWNTRSS